jgi:hypothetical protein
MCSCGSAPMLRISLGMLGVFTSKRPITWDAVHGLLLLMGDYICYWLAAVTVLAGATVRRL